MTREGKREVANGRQYGTCQCGDPAVMIFGRRPWCAECAAELMTGEVNIEGILEENANRRSSSSGLHHNDGCLDNGVRVLER